MIIDCSGSLPTEEFFLADVEAMRHSRYLQIFGRGCARWVGMDAAEAEQLLTHDTDQFVDRILELAVQNGRDQMEPYLEAIDEAGISRSVLHNFHERGLGGLDPVLPNDRIADICCAFPDRFIGFAGIDPSDPSAAVAEVQRAKHELGLQGIGLRPFRHRMLANDVRYYPIYEEAQALGLPVWVHSSINYEQGASLDYGRPIYLDQVAADFPALKILAGHGGWPYAAEMVACAMRNPNIFIDVSAVRHAHMPKVGSGWEPILHFGNSVLQDQMVIGFDWLQLGYRPKQLVEEIGALPLRDSVRAKWLGENAARIFGL